MLLTGHIISKKRIRQNAYETPEAYQCEIRHIRRVL